MTELFAQKFTPLALEECWLWEAAKDHDGYGRFGFRGRNTKAHRVMFVFENGEIPEGMQVLHSCDNPSCVNPNHLFLGTHTDNMQDMGKKGRRRDYTGPRPWRKNCPKDSKGRFCRGK